MPRKSKKGGCNQCRVLKTVLHQFMIHVCVNRLLLIKFVHTDGSIGPRHGCAVSSTIRKARAYHFSEGCHKISVLIGINYCFWTIPRDVAILLRLHTESALPDLPIPVYRARAASQIAVPAWETFEKQPFQAVFRLVYRYKVYCVLFSNCLCSYLK